MPNNLLRFRNYALAPTMNKSCALANYDARAPGAMVGADAIGRGEHRDASGPQQAEDFGECALVGEQVLEHAERNDRIEQAVGEAGGFGIGDREMAAVAMGVVGHACAAMRDHLRAEVDAPELICAAEQRVGHHRRTAANVEHTLDAPRQELQGDAPLRAERELMFPLARIVLGGRVEIATNLRGLVQHTLAWHRDRTSAWPP